MIEYEATFIDINKDEIRNKLKTLNAKLIRPEFLMRRVVFETPERNFSKWTRVRDEGDKITMSYKQVEGEGITSQKEVCVEVDNFEEAEKFLELVGCLKKAYQENKREIWQLDDVEICIDHWPFLAPVVEIEGKDEDSVRKVASLLGFDYKKAIFSFIDTVYAQKYNFPVEQLSKQPVLKFDMKNPFLE